jgi:hypothetical protein
MSSVTSSSRTSGDVVLGDDPDEPLLLIDHRHGEQVVVREQAGGVLAVGGRAGHGSSSRHQCIDAGSRAH